MAQATALELLASTALTADGASTAVAITGLQRVAQLTIAVTEYTSSGSGHSVKVYIERRATTSDPWVSDVLAVDDEGNDTLSTMFTGTGSQIVGVEVGPLTRVRYDLTNVTSVTLAVSGTMHTVYARPSELGQAVLARAIRELSLADKVQACINATADADGRLGLSYKLPLAAWSPDLTLKTAQLAVAQLFSMRGADIGGPDALVFTERDRANSWLNLVAAGRIKPAGIVDATPDVYRAGAVVVSRPPRRW